MDGIAAPFVFLIGLALGSFANVLIARWQRPEGILRSHSSCPHCRHRLTWVDLIPLLSFFLLRGRCRYCAKPISCQYPLVELAVGILAVALLFRFGIALPLLFHLLLLPLLAALFIVDLKTMILPNIYLAPAFALGIVAYFAANGLATAALANILLGIIAAAGFLMALFAAGRGKWMGFGDVKYGVFLGAYLGWPLAVAAMFIAFLSGSLVSGVLVAAGRRKMRSAVPFGPFLVLGTLMALLGGPAILAAYAKWMVW